MKFGLSGQQNVAWVLGRMSQWIIVFVGLFSATMIKTYDGRKIVVPNAQLFNKSVIVKTAFTLLRSECLVGIGYEEDIQNTKGIILETVKQIDGVAKDPAPLVHVVELAPSTLNLKVRWWSQSDVSTLLHTRDQVIERLAMAFKEKGIELPFPTQNVLLFDKSKEKSRDKSRDKSQRESGSNLEQD